MGGTGKTLKAEERPDLLTCLYFAATMLLSWIFRDYQVCNAETFALWESLRTYFIFYFFKICHIQGCSENKKAFRRKNLYCKRELSGGRDTCGLLCISPKVQFLYRSVSFPIGMLWEAAPVCSGTKEGTHPHKNPSDDKMSILSVMLNMEKHWKGGGGSSGIQASADVSV